MSSIYTISQPNDDIANEQGNQVNGPTNGNFEIFRHFQKIEFDTNLFSDNDLIIIENHDDDSSKDIAFEFVACEVDSLNSTVDAHKTSSTDNLTILGLKSDNKIEETVSITQKIISVFQTRNFPHLIKKILVFSQKKFA